MRIEKSIQNSPYIIKGEKKSMHGVRVVYHQISHFVTEVIKLQISRQSFSKIKKRAILRCVGAKSQVINHFVMELIQNSN